MRFISRYGKNGVAIRGEIVESYANGGRRVTQTLLAAYFQPYLLTQDERQLALDHFYFNGSYQEQDEVTLVPPDYRIGLFDSRIAQEQNGWSDDERQLVEEKLLRVAQETPDTLLLVPEHTLQPPWPNYDLFEGSPLELAEKIAEDGYRLAEVVAYERENQNREDVIEALEELLSGDASVPVAAEEIVG
jgi:hypothetical protein